MAADNEHAHVKYTVNQIGCVTFAHPGIYFDILMHNYVQRSFPFFRLFTFFSFFMIYFYFFTIFFRFFVGWEFFSFFQDFFFSFFMG